MNIAEARSYSDGISFYIKEKNITINARRDENGNIVITKDNMIRPIEKIKNNPLDVLAISILFSFIIKYCNIIGGWKMAILAILASIWIITLGYYFISSKNPNNVKIFRYHAAEHKVLNYWDKYGKATLDCDEVIKMSSLSFRCGSTIIAVNLVLITLSILGILFIPWLILKIVWCIISIFITLYLWANGKCDFLQKFVVITPERAEVEVAVRGMWEYVKIKSE